MDPISFNNAKARTFIRDVITESKLDTWTEITHNTFALWITMGTQRYRIEISRKKSRIKVCSFDRNEKGDYFYTNLFMFYGLNDGVEKKIYELKSYFNDKKEKEIQIKRHNFMEMIFAKQNGWL